MANILIIHDQSCVRQLISEELIFEGHQVRSLGGTELVREHLQGFQPDLVLLDLYLDGFEVCRDIKCEASPPSRAGVLPYGSASQPGKEIGHSEIAPLDPVLILTAYDSFQDDSRLRMADGYVVKSRNFTELKTMIFNVLEEQPAPRKEIAIQQYLCDFGVGVTV